MAPTVHTLDHLVLTVRDIDKACAFYAEILGMLPETFTPPNGLPRQALRYGAQKINLHIAGREFAPKARNPGPGTADLCFLSATPLDVWQAHLAQHGVPVLQGPTHRIGAQGPILSLYVRDPDDNLIEISNQL